MRISNIEVVFILVIGVIVSLSGCKKELSTSPEEVYLHKNGLIIESIPEGAKIYVNGKNTGQFTPDTLLWLNPGNVLVTLKKELFKDSSLVVNVKEDDTIKVFFDYTTNKTMLGKLYIDSNPRGASIFLNDSDMSLKTPVTVTGLVPGYYNVECRLKGYWNEKKIYPVKSVVTTYTDLQLHDTLVWINYNKARTPIPSDYLSCITIEKGYIKWMGSIDAGLIRFDDETWTVFNTENSIIPDNNINSVAIDDFGVLWICTNYGVVKKYEDTWTLFNTSNSNLPDNKVLSVTTDGINTCFGTKDKGMVIFDGINWVNHTTSNSPMPSNQVNSVLYHDGILWGCTDNGLVRKTDTTWKIIDYSNSSTVAGNPTPGSFVPRSTGFPNNNCKTIAIDRRGKPWVGFGTQSGAPGGCSYVKYTVVWRSYHSKPSPDVFSIAVDMNDVKWFGSSENGLSKIEAAKWTHYKMSNSKIQTDRIYGVIIDQNSNKYMASFGAGLIKYKGN
jgi:hypothetical protein